MAIGAATLLPGRANLWVGATGGTVSARYCYGVWLRHMKMADRVGLNTHPQVVAELGPGDSLGIGLAALLSGARQYYAFDVVEYADLSRNLDVLDELIELFEDRAALPGDDEFPEMKPRLEDYGFPTFLNDERLNEALAPARVDRIRAALADPGADTMIQYKVPWFDAEVADGGSVDLVFSQAAMEHVDDLAGAYQAMHRWLSDSGYISHQIDFRCHGTAGEWNGHWRHGDLTWRIIRGRSPYLLNRAPYSAHLKLCDAVGFEVVQERRVSSESSFGIDALAPRFRDMAENDLTTSGAFIQARKRPTHAG